MLLMQHNQEGLRRRLLTIGIPRHTIDPLIKDMVKWESCSGVEWTIKRLKGLKVDLIRQRTGLPPLTWIRKNSKKEIAGHIGSIFRWAMIGDKNFSKAVQAFMAYTFYILPSLTETQKKKFLDAINPVNTGDGLTEDFHKSFAETVHRTIRRRSILVKHRPLVTYQGSPGKKAPTTWGKSVPQAEQILKELEYFQLNSGSLFSRYQRLYDPLLVGIGNQRKFLNYIAKVGKIEKEPKPVLGGEIHFLQEPGGKLRSIASPFRLHQEALYPLGQSIYDIVKSLPWDCTFDQQKAIPAIQAHLAKGGQVHSIDLSNATDYFPLTLQETALRAIFDISDWDHIDLFAEISRGVWKSNIGFLRWTKGQPLGLYPSFASFTLTHGLLLLHLAGGHYDNQFYVVGDDVVILDEKLKENYISMLQKMACPWSVDKSLSSSGLSEFTGKIITSTMVIPQLKWRRMSDDNFLDICRLLGSKSRALLTKRQQSVFDQVAHLCAPIGLNFSLPGDNLVKMVERTERFYRPEKFVLGALMGLRRKLNTVVHTSTTHFDNDELSKLAETFDEKVKSVLAQTIFARWQSAVAIGLDALSSIPEALGLEPRLPLQEKLPSRVTTLERYERLLKVNNQS